MSNFNHFDYVPSSIQKKRSIFPFDKPIVTSAYLGWLYPMCKPVRMMPGSTLKLNLAMEIRSSALISPLADELLCDCFAFSVPNRIVWEHWKQFLGSVDDVLFDNLTEYTIPNFLYRSFANAPTNPGLAWNQSLASCFELPYLVIPNANTGYMPHISALPFRGYTFIWNEFFRPEQLVEPILFSKTDAGGSGGNITASSTSYSFNGESIDGWMLYGSNSSNVNYANGGAVLPVFRVHRNLWLSCLPKPSLESPSILSAVEGFPVVTNLQETNNAGWNSGTGNINLIKLQPKTSNPATAADWSQVMLSVNSLRETLLLQSYYDVLNRAGSRYDEILRNLFHTQASDAIIDIPELIVHKRFTIYRNQVIATAETVNADGETLNPVGTQSSYIDTIIRDSFFTKSTTEHGYIHLLYAIRPAHLRMSQGIEPEWRQLTKFDQYYPQFDGMGDVPRYKDEMFYDVSKSEAQNKEIFGYQEYGAEWKSQRASATGWMNPYIPNALTTYALTEKLSAQPSLAFAGYQSYLTCWSEMEAFARCLSISSPAIAPQFKVDIHLTGEIVHPMPVYNIPGMGDVL